ncbi:MAG: methyltransferase domain-containing protein [Chloroflexales bacterium]|nr:methyltransferase domain-containing protein [Chloroflexales bacterium]
MPRGRYPARLKTILPSEKALAHYLIVWGNAELYANPERFPPIGSVQLFGNQQPLALEVGCATGEFLCELAARTPNVNFLGVEIVRKPLYRAVARAVQRSLSNIKFLQVDIRLLCSQLLPDSLQAVYLHFPVPVMTARQRRHGVLTATFLDHVYRALAPGGRLSVITDKPAVFAAVEQLAQHDQRFRLVPLDQHRLAIDEGLKSHHHQLWEERGCAILSCELEKPIMFER